MRIFGFSLCSLDTCWGYVPELNNQDEGGGFIMEGGMYERGMQQVLLTVEFGAGCILKNNLVLVPARGDDGKR